LFLQFGMGVVTEKQGKFSNLAFPNPVFQEVNVYIDKFNVYK
jgi:hypothetical protein